MTESQQTGTAAERRDDLGESELLARLAALPTPELPAGTGERTQRRARAAFVRHAERAQHPWWDRLARAYDVFEPIMATAVASAYLFWAFSSAASALLP